jgi:hypothetical protein
VTTLLLLLVLAPDRVYHRVPLEKVAASARTHIETCGPVVYVRKQQDGDVHVTLDNGKARVVVEIIPLVPLTAPKTGQTIRVRGISRFDKSHRFAEIHPAEQIDVVKDCRVQKENR